MPTLIVLDSSASLIRPISVEEKSTTRQDLIQRGILNFLQGLEKAHPLEPVALASFSSSGQLHVDFTRDHSALRNALYDIELRDCSDVDEALEFISGVISSRFGDHVHSVQVVLVVDGCPLRVPQHTFALSKIPSGLKVHVAIVGTAEELKNSSPFSAISERTEGEFFATELPLQARSFKHSFEHLLASTYVPYIGKLALGHAVSAVRLSPDPNLGLRVSMGPAVVVIPTLLTIRGFVSFNDMHCVPTRARYVLSSGEGEADEGLLTIFRAALWADRKVAVINLSHSCVALLQPTASELILLVLAEAHPGCIITELSLIASGRVHAIGTPSMAPEQPDVPFTPESLKASFEKIKKLLDGLPAKKDQLGKECEKIRRISAVYSSPSISQALRTILLEAKRLAPPAHGITITDLLKIFPE